MLQQPGDGIGGAVHPQAVEGGREQEASGGAETMVGSRMLELLAGDPKRVDQLALSRHRGSFTELLMQNRFNVDAPSYGFDLILK